MAAYGVYGTLDDLDVSKEYEIPVPYLPRSMEGLTVVQLSDLHVGPYIRETELRHLVSVTNQLRPDIVVITGDILDRSLDSLPDTVKGLAGLKATMGVFAVLGNHDISTDRYSFSGEHRGGVNITKGIETIGIRTLRNEVVHLGSGQDRVALMGLDWPSYNRGRNFYNYQQTRTQRLLDRMAGDAGPETPRVLLAHHPDTFTAVHQHAIGLTLAGHTHGGGQVILADLSGTPIGIGMFRFKYLSGLYQEGGSSLLRQSRNRVSRNSHPHQLPSGDQPLQARFPDGSLFPHPSLSRDGQSPEHISCSLVDSTRMLLSDRSCSRTVS